jgi:hypothetical protein
MDFAWIQLLIHGMKLCLDWEPSAGLAAWAHGGELANLGSSRRCDRIKTGCYPAGGIRPPLANVLNYASTMWSQDHYMNNLTNLTAKFCCSYWHIYSSDHPKDEVKRETCHLRMTLIVAKRRFKATPYSQKTYPLATLSAKTTNIITNYDGSSSSS